MTASRTAHLARYAAAAFVVAGGAVHLQLWLGGYRGLPVIGPLFVVNFAASLALAGVAAMRGGARVLLVALAFSLGSLGALVMSRTVGLFGFAETWTPQALQTLAFELGAILLLVTSLAAERRPALAR